MGYRVKSPRGTQFRIWATKTLRKYILKGFALDHERMKQGNPYFAPLNKRRLSALPRCGERA